MSPTLARTEAVNSELPGYCDEIRRAASPSSITIAHGEVDGLKAAELMHDRASPQAEARDEIGDSLRQFDPQQQPDAERNLTQSEASPEVPPELPEG